MISELLTYDFMQRAYSRRDCYQYLLTNFGALLDSSSSESDE